MAKSGFPRLHERGTGRRTPGYCLHSHATAWDTGSPPWNGQVASSNYVVLYMYLEFCSLFSALAVEIFSQRSDQSSHSQFTQIYSHEKFVLPLKQPFFLRGLIPAFTISQNGWVWWHLWRSSHPAALLRAGSARAGSLGLCPVASWISPRMETPKPLWATCSGVWPASR